MGGLRLAYVAQHAFHHLEKHMDKTPTQYIMWRFAGNDDKESLEFKSDELSVDEEAARAQKWCIDGVTGNVRRVTSPKEDPKKAKQDEGAVVVPSAILNRRQKKKEKTFEYEVTWQFKPTDCNCWVEKDILVAMGYLKLVQREDEKQAAMAGLQTKQLTQPGVEKHLGNFGVDPESASHTQISQLSGGMKVKVVLAVKDYKGGVLIISHNKEFCDGVATEKWIMNKGKLRIEGAPEEEAAEAKDKALGPKEDVYDGAGNKIDVKANAAVSAKDAKKQIKDLEKKLKDGLKKKTLTEEELWELEDKITALKEKLEAA